MILFHEKDIARENVRRSRSGEVDDASQWVLENEVTEIEMSERQFWNFAQLQPISEKPWVTFMGRRLRVPNMPVDAQKHLGIDDKMAPGVI